MKNRIIIATAMTALMGLSACTDPAYLNSGGGYQDPNARAKQGALAGAAIGGLAGAITGGDDRSDKLRGAAIGAALGAGAGAIIGNQLDKQAAELRNSMNNSAIDVTNTGDRLVVTMPQSILFATDSTAVSGALRGDLAALANNLNSYPNSRVQVIGHTDNVGDAGYNQDLSQRRASAVADVLFQNGVSYSRVSTIGRGEDAPIATNLTPEGRAANRRVEIVIIPNN
ncbi:MAG: OmpA family protein [Donghicola eburneus]|jgi:outer membrane protein OmpA-like peptidoglycan-associated protein|uniref:OmpA family protein n=1 Tax=Donghicola sp. XS_ASV15 TaxID=3241295 RepID=UPI0026EB0B2F|nr:OmpA family protein [Donghicola eburneus]MCI5042910.1 OmpA family protein [Donghicola eburneus]